MSNQKIHELGTQEIEVNAAEEDRSQHETDSGRALDSSPAHTGSSTARHTAAQTRRVSAGQWMREVTGFNAPFGHDGLPTVWG